MEELIASTDSTFNKTKAYFFTIRAFTGAINLAFPSFLVFLQSDLATIYLFVPGFIKDFSVN